MATKTNELSVWQNDAPVVTIGNAEFEIWQDDAPVVDQDESSPDQAVARRRPHIY
jgi:hypothetical protein